MSMPGPAQLFKQIALLLLLVTPACQAEDLSEPQNRPPVRLDAAHGFAAQQAVVIEGNGKLGNYAYQLDAAPLQLRMVHFEGEAQVEPGASLALNAFVVARRGHSPLDFVNLVEHPITAGQPDWVPFTLELLVPPTSESVQIGFSVTGIGQVAVRHIEIRHDSTRPVPMTPEVEAYLVEALREIHDSSLYRESVDWNQLRDYLLLRANHAQQTSDTYEALRIGLKLLDDRHSRLLSPEEAQLLLAPEVADPPRVEQFGDHIATLTIPAFAGISAQASRTYVQSAAAPLIQAASRARCGWVVDLRTDSGGDMWPMLSVLAPFFTDGKLGAFNYRDHIDVWTLRHGMLFEGSTPRLRVPRGATTLQHARIAVLIGASTASSGEAVAVALHGRPGTRFFGAATAALATSNDFHVLSDGAVLLVTSAVDADRRGIVFSDGVPPDQMVAQPKGDARDEAMLAARSWLRALCKSASADLRMHH